MLDAERDYWQPRVAVHFGAKLLQVGDVRLRPRDIARARRLEPDRTQADASRARHASTVDHEEFFGFQHGDGRLRLIERLAAAHRAGELPDYMLEFVDMLRTR